jgi:hypothetical protein
MNEFPGPGQQPAGNPRGWASRATRTRWIEEAEEERARRQAVPADGPVRVRIVWDAGMPSPVARGLGQAERDWFRSPVGPGPLGPRTVREVQYVDFTLSVGDGFVVDSPALPHIAVGKIADAINVLLVPARPDRDPDPLSPVEKIRPYSNPVFRPMG